MPITCVATERRLAKKLGRELIAEADLILGIDVMTKRTTIAYGIDQLIRMQKAKKSKRLEVVCIELDADEKSDDLERLAALMQIIKGHHDLQ